MSTSRLIWFGAAALAIGAGVYFGSRPAEAPPPSAPKVQFATGRTLGDIGVELVIGGRVCASGAAPCLWRTAVEPIAVHYRRASGATMRYLAVVARDSSGAIWPLVVDGGEAWRTREIDATEARDNLKCARGFCWIASGRFEPPPGPVEVRAVFTTAPLERTALERVARGEGDHGGGRRVERVALDALGP